MNAFACPFCGSPDVRFSSSIFRHWLRVFIGSRKRYCHSCEEKWGDSASRHAPNLVRGGIVAAFFGFLGLLAYAWFAPPDSSSDALRADAPDSNPNHKRDEIKFTNVLNDNIANDSFHRTVLASVPNRLDVAQKPNTWWKFWKNQNYSDLIKHSPPALMAAGISVDANSSLQNLQNLLMKISGSSEQGKIDELMKLDKHTLWDRYGQYFASKEQAKAAYDQYKSSHKLPGHLPNNQ